MAFFLHRNLIKLSPRVICRRSLLLVREESQSRLLSTESRRLVGKVALITGAASGIGKATAAEFIKNGAKVILADIQSQAGEAVAADLGPNATYLQCDVAQESSISAAVDFAVSHHGHLDVVYNNAGISGSTSLSLADLDLDDFDRVIRVNLRGVVVGVKHAARVMVPRRSGCIICTSSIGGILGGLTPFPYSVSKSAVVGLVKSAAAELSEYGIRVNCISPMAIPTPIMLDYVSKLYPGLDSDRKREMIHGVGELKGADCEPRDIALAALYIASDEAKYVSGHNLVVDGGFTSTKSFRFPAPGAELN